MGEDFLASSELYSTFPHYEKSFSGKIPTLVIPKSKYSSTETELSSDSAFEENTNVGNYTGRPSLSGISTSAASSSGSIQRRKKRRRMRTVSGKISLSSLSVGNKSTSRSVSSSSLNNAEQRKDGNDEKAENAWNVNERRTKYLPVLNSVNDLKHATGRHRGISGSTVPAVDAALFAIFYVTDIFDELFTDTTSELLHPQYVQINRNRQIKKDFILLLRKEIVYSLRINYFCPASKVVKLMQLVEEHYPFDHIQDSAGFLDLLFCELLKLQPFLKYSNGSSGYIHSINLENYLTRKYYYQPTALTVQQLLHQKSIFSTLNSKRNYYGGRNDFVTIPYPALILKIIRKDTSAKNTDDESMYYWDQSSETHHHYHKRPVIPNLKIDITDIISRNNKYENSSLQRSSSRNWNENMSISNNSLSSISLYKSQHDFCLPEDDVDQGVDVTKPNRFLKGLKSAWNTVYGYLEDLTNSSSHINPQEPGLSPMYADNSNTDDEINHTRSPRWNLLDDGVDEKRRWNSVGKINNLSSPAQSLLSIPSSSSYPNYHDSKIDLEESFAASISQQIQIKMELIAIICKTKKRERMKDQAEKSSESRESFSRYAVYCKAGDDVSINGEHQQFAPWMLYESKNGSAPEVVLIENFGKWIDSLEKHHDSINLLDIPMEIRRVLEDSNLFIYKRLDK